VKNIHILIWCAAAAILAIVAMDVWDQQTAPIYKRLERQWHDDIRELEDSKKLPAAWFDVGQIEIVGGTNETKDWLKHIQSPLTPKANGHYKLDVLLVGWEETGKRGAMIQYNLEDLGTKNTIWELGRTLILSPQPNPSLSDFWRNLSQ
jgi:hypothetical protein